MNKAYKTSCLKHNVLNITTLNSVVYIVGVKLLRPWIGQIGYFKLKLNYKSFHTKNDSERGQSVNLYNNQEYFIIHLYFYYSNIFYF